MSGIKTNRLSCMHILHQQNLYKADVSLLRSRGSPLVPQVHGYLKNPFHSCSGVVVVGRVHFLRLDASDQGMDRFSASDSLK